MGGAAHSWGLRQGQFRLPGSNVKVPKPCRSDKTPHQAVRGGCLGRRRPRLGGLLALQDVVPQVACAQSRMLVTSFASNLAGGDDPLMETHLHMLEAATAILTDQTAVNSRTNVIAAVHGLVDGGLAVQAVGQHAAQVHDGAVLAHHAR